MKWSLGYRRYIMPDASRPARGAWVEILAYPQFVGVVIVAPRKGRVG